jgi:hypothetical protein
MTKWVVALIAALAIVPRAWAVEPDCPAAIKVEEKLLGPLENGWTEGHADEPHRLAGITIFDGRPEERASLVPTERVISATRSLATWSFVKGRQYWMTCSYSGTGVVLSRAIAGTVASCSVTYARNVRVAGLPEIQRMECK